MDITLFIPTFNRPDFLLKALQYYQSVNFRGKIFIGDSSELAAAKKIKDYLYQFDSLLEVCYYSLPGYKAAQVLRIMADKVNTKYAAYIADDDFLVPSGIGQSIEFLDTHPDYIAAHGVGLGISLNPDNFQSIQYTSYYPQPIIPESIAAQRLIAYLSNYTVSLFSVHRSEAWHIMFKNAGGVTDRTFVEELLPCCLSIVLGKIKQVDGLYLVRGYHDGRYLLPSWFKWITNEAWYPSYTAFCNCLAEEIVRQDEIALDEAKCAIEKAFAVYLAQSSIPRNTSKWRSIVKQIPGARILRNALEPLRNKYCLNNMLKPKSPYYKDFMPVYKIVTQRQVGIP